MFTVTEYGIEYSKVLGIFDTKELAEQFKSDIINKEYFGKDDPMLEDISFKVEKFKQHKIPNKRVRGFCIEYDLNSKYNNICAENSCAYIKNVSNIDKDPFYSAFDDLYWISIEDWRESKIYGFEIYVYFIMPEDIKTYDEFVNKYIGIAKEVASAVVKNKDIKRFSEDK